MKSILPATIALLAFVLVYGPKSNLTAAAEVTPSSPSPKLTVAGTVTQSDAYSGGAKPSEERLKKLTAPRAYPGKKFHVIRGGTNTVAREIVLTFTTDEAGHFSFQIVPGTYAILVDEQWSPPDAKKYQTKSIHVDEAAYNQWWAKPYHLLEVKAADITGLKFHFHHRSFIAYDIPALRYTGPYPP